MRKHLLPLIIFMLLIIVLTFPLVLKITTYIPGFFSTDEIYAPLWNAWRIKSSLANGLSAWKTDFIAYPFGMDFYTNLPIGYLWYFINNSLAVLTTPVLTYNLQIVFCFLLLAFFSYLLVFNLTKNKFSAVFSGIIFGFSPYIFVRSWQHLAEMYHWSLPLFLLSIFRLRDDNRLRIKILFVLSFVLTSINFTDTFFTSIILGVLLIFLLGNWQKNKRYVKKMIILSAIAFIVIIPTFLPFFKNIIFNRNSAPSGYSAYHRPFEDLFSQSAKPLSYVLPAAVHPVFGRFTEQFIGSQLYGISFTEHTLYLGWVPLILAFIAFKRWRKNKKLSANRYTLNAEEGFYIGFFVWLAIVAWLFSQPPWWQWGKFKIYMPSFFMYKILPMFRAYCRFGIVVMLAAAVLAGFGLKFILDKLKSQKSKIAMTIICCGVVLFEFWNYPPFKVIDVSKVPEAYYWLKGQPGDFAIAEYPFTVNYPIETYKFYQTKHEKKMINGGIPGTYAFKVSEVMADLSNKNTPKMLKWVGVKYVFVHRGAYLNSELEEMHEELNNLPKNPGLKLIRSFVSQECPQRDIMCVKKTGPIDVYEVIASPVKPPVKE